MIYSRWVSVQLSVSLHPTEKRALRNLWPVQSQSLTGYYCFNVVPTDAGLKCLFLVLYTFRFVSEPLAYVDAPLCFFRGLPAPHIPLGFSPLSPLLRAPVFDCQ
jgi:hypothetical protein